MPDANPYQNAKRYPQAQVFFKKGNFFFFGGHWLLVIKLLGKWLLWFERKLK
jgi:hypothetical protein